MINNKEINNAGINEMSDLLNIQDRLNTFEFEVETIIEKLIENAKNHPDKIALVYKNIKLSYAELNAKVDYLASYLFAELKVKNDMLIGICMERSIEMVVSILAVLRSGAAYVPLDPSYPVKRLEHILNDTKLNIILSHSAQTKISIFDDIKTVVDVNSLLSEELPKSDAYIPNNIYSNNLAYVIYTSGSTGYPKGVMIEHGSLVNLAQNMFNLSLGSENDAWGWIASFAFDASLQGITQLCFGKTLVIIDEQDKVDIEKITESINSNQIGVFDCSPALLEHWISQSNNKLEINVDLVIGGEAINHKLWASMVAYQKRSARKTYNVYGPTECTVNSTIYRIEGETPLIGNIMPNMLGLILNEKFEPVSTGEIGELYVGGKCLARGYLNQPKLTQKSFIKNPFYDVEKGNTGCELLYKTGDLVSYTNDGYIKYIGRKDQQVKIHGYRVELGEIEHQINKIESIDSSVVIIQTVNKSPQLVAYVKKISKSEPLIDNDQHGIEIKRILEQHLPHYMIPRIIAIVNKWPLTMNGKIDREKLVLPQLIAENTKPLTKFEQNLSELIQDAINIKIQSSHIEFSNYGIDSIRSLKLVAIINKKYNLSLTPYLLASGNFTLASLSNEIIHLKKGGSKINSIEKFQSIPKECEISFSQERYYDFYENNDVNDNFPIIYKIEGCFDIERLKNSIKRIYQEQSALRSAFHRISSDRVIQSVIETELVIKTASLGNQSISDFFERELNYRFDYSDEDLFRAMIVKENFNTHYLMINMPDIIFDGWSKMILQKYLTSYYKCKEANTKSNDFDSFSYRSFSLWEKNYVSAQRKEKAQSFWLSHFNGMTDTFFVPYDINITSIDINSGGIISHIATDSELKMVNKLCTSTGTTPFYVFYTIFASVIYDIYKIDDICAMLPVANRRLAETHDLIGCFLNRIALRYKYDPNKNIADNIISAKSQLKECFNYDYFPYQKLIKEFKKATNYRLPTPSSLLIGGQMMHATPLNIDGAIVTEKPLTDEVLAKNDFSLFYEDHNETIRFLFRYKKSRYSFEKVSEIKQRFIEKLS